MSDLEPRYVRRLDIAYIFGVKTNVVANWVKRYDDFPEPKFEIAGGSILIYDQDEVVRWWMARSPKLIEALRRVWDGDSGSS